MRITIRANKNINFPWFDFPQMENERWRKRRRKKTVDRDEKVVPNYIDSHMLEKKFMRLRNSVPFQRIVVLETHTRSSSCTIYGIARSTAIHVFYKLRVNRYYTCRFACKTFVWNIKKDVYIDDNFPLIFLNLLNFILNKTFKRLYTRFSKSSRLTVNVIIYDYSSVYINRKVYITVYLRRKSPFRATKSRWFDSNFVSRFEKKKKDSYS